MCHQRESSKIPDYKTEDISLISFSNLTEVFWRWVFLPASLPMALHYTLAQAYC